MTSETNKRSPAMNESWFDTRDRLRDALGRTPATDAGVIAETKLAPQEKFDWPRSERAFKTEVDGKTIITGPAAAFLEKSSTTNPMFLNIIGRFVGAEKANRNRALWTTEDLTFGQPTVKHGPLNWLHEARHIVGSITEAALLTSEAAGDEQEPPYIAAGASMWKWLWPNEAAVVEMAAAAGNLWYCVDDQTELLTADGWRRHDELVGDETILTLNTTYGMSEWLPLDKVHRYEVDAELTSFEGQQMSALVTDNHRWAVQQRRGPGDMEFQWRETHELTNQSYIPRAVQHNHSADAAKFRDELVELVAWMWTEGTFTPSGASVIYQSHKVNDAYVERIRTCLFRLAGTPAKVRDGGRWYASHHGDMTHFHLSKELTGLLDVIIRRDEDGAKVVNERWFAQLSEAQLRLFIETSIDADGTRAKADGQTSISQKSLEAIRSFEVACALAGIPTNTIQNGDGMWRTCLVRRSSLIAPRRLARMGNGFVESKQHYVGTVWCPSTPNGTFLARRNGTVYWTGNSMECVSESVVCYGDDGCGTEVAYMDAVQRNGNCCEHLRERSADRRFKDPTFLGGAVIVPPVRPGWDSANATILSEAAKIAEKAYESAGEPDVASGDWERLLAQVLTFARG